MPSAWARLLIESAIGNFASAEREALEGHWTARWFGLAGMRRNAPSCLPHWNRRNAAAVFPLMIFVGTRAQGVGGSLLFAPR